MAKKYNMIIQTAATDDTEHSAEVVEDIEDTEVVEDTEDLMAIDFHSMSKAQLQEFADSRGIPNINMNSQSKDAMITDIINHLHFAEL